MIAKISGILIYKSIEYIIIDVNGVGYKIFVPYSTYYNLPDVNQPVSLEIHTHARNEGIDLYGFFTPEEKGLFESLIAISKIGPKLATNILSGSPVEELKKAISHQDTARIASIPGIGQKTAGRIVLELKDKIGDGFPEKEVILKEDRESDQMVLDSISALINLGYNKKTAKEAVEKARESLGDDAKFEEILKGSLKTLAR